MNKPNLSVLSDWPFCVGAVLAALGIILIVALLPSTSLDPATLIVAVPLTCWTGFWLLIVGWRIWIMRRINREGIIVMSHVKDVWFHGNRTRTVWVDYTYNSQPISTRFSPWGLPPFPEKGQQIQLVIDPRKPTRCWVHKG